MTAGFVIGGTTIHDDDADAIDMDFFEKSLIEKDKTQCNPKLDPNAYANYCQMKHSASMACLDQMHRQRHVKESGMRVYCCRLVNLANRR